MGTGYCKNVKCEFHDNTLRDCCSADDAEYDDCEEAEWSFEAKEEMIKKMYMNAETGSVDTKDGWYYEDIDGKTVNAADKEEVVEVERNKKGDWVMV